MDKSMENIFTRGSAGFPPPPTIKVGQVWYVGPYHYVITDTQNIHLGIVRAMFIGAAKWLNKWAEGYDIPMPKSENLFPTRRTIFVLTTGVLHEKQLKLFLGQVSTNLTKKIIFAEKNLLTIPHPRTKQGVVVNRIFEFSHRDHMVAMNYYEDSLLD